MTIWECKTEEDYLKWIEEHKKSLEAQEKDKTVFYSGFAGKQTAEELASRGFSVLEKTEGGQELAKNDPWFNTNLTDSERRNVWNKASEIYAKSAEGEVFAYTKGASDKSTFLNIELLALLENDKVTKINGIDKAELKTIWDKAEDKEQAKKEINEKIEIKQITWEPTFKEPDPKQKEEIQKQERVEVERKEEQAKAEARKKEDLPPIEKTKEEVEKEEKIAKKIVDAVIDEAKSAAIGAIGGSALATAYEAKKAYDEAEKPKATAAEQPKQEHQDKEVEQRYKVKVEHEGKNYTVKIEAASPQEAQQQALSLFEDKDFVDNLKGLKAGQTLNARVDFDEATPKSPFQAEEEKKKKEEQKVEIKIEEPKLSL